MKNRANTIHLKKNSGFTLIEMIVTVTIVAIFASFAVPSFSELIKNNRIPTTANEFISSLVLARSEALKRSRDVSLCASNNQTTCNGGTDYSDGWIVYADCDGNDALTAGPVDCNDDSVLDEEEIIKVHNGFEKIFINSGSNNITFLFSGRIANATTFNLGHESDSATVKQVVINRVGRIRSQ